jgi:hypothetical protein
MTDVFEERLRAAADQAMTGVELAPPVSDDDITLPRRHPRWLNAAAGIAAAVVLGVVVWAAALRDPGPTEPVRPSPDAVSTTVAPDITEGLPDWGVQTAITFDPDVAPATAVLDATITNRSDAAWSFECSKGGLYRWDGEATDFLGYVIWNDDRLYVSEQPVDPECPEPRPLLPPGATEVRSLRLDATVDGDGRPLALEPGAYQLVFSEPFTGAVGEFVVTDD